ncbi:G-type lectin S-receptor-like serine/threonine-protein kinase LECRK3 isoform X1 [Phoenix dactylifera]|uniref:Receptor-like serine/threonine-protein kinase n=1 Tax=Phoenix dactylifera TaxID=42345 RepID=A0A8B9AEX3_PHODC|nr:G-type lectin S-receptor-like serine/threonine-protein kinase LECRK3 isoform X1 [Phoenix dactylifera]
MESPRLPLHLFLPLLPQIILLIIGSTYAQTIISGKISLGSSRTAQTGQTAAWFSPSGDFAFGFRPLETDGNHFLLAIWFDKIESKTVAWYANGNQSVRAGAAVGLATDGKLSLQDHDAKEVWSVRVNSSVAYAAMLDNGNFVLASSDGLVRWQSFDNPSDTILPSQVLGPGKELRSRLMDTEYCGGRFDLIIQSDGNLTFYPIEVISGYKYDPYWSSGTSGNGSQLVFDESGTIYLALTNNTVFMNFSSGRMDSVGDFYQRATLDPDGVFRQYVYPKNTTTSGGGGGWTVVDFQPPDICREITTATGSGACGFNSYCVSGGGDRSVDCECPPGYAFEDQSRKYKGCFPNFAAQICGTNESVTETQFELKEMINVDWPLSAYEHSSPIDEERCKRKCLRDCNCAVAVYQDDGGNCWKKRLPLSNGKMGSYVDRKAFIKVAKVSKDSIKDDSSKRKPVIAVLIPLVLGGLLLLCLGLLVWKKIRNRGISHDFHFNENRGKELELPLFNLSMIESATNFFSADNLLGKGGFGPVYKGQLGDGQEIAVKRLSKNSVQGVDEFKNEVVLIAKLQHRNLVRLLGCCIQHEERMLIYEYMPNRSLDTFIFDKTKSAQLGWQERLDIIMGIARGLLYLHQDSRLRIIHRDLKSSNILLDKDMNPKISDFGTARIFKGDQNEENTRRVIGTYGYMPPEYAMEGIFSVKSDVFSFGVIILEILSGKKIRMVYEAESSVNLLGHAWKLWEDGRCLELLDEAMGCSYPTSRVLRCLQVGLLCVQEGRDDRPTMAEVVLMLSNEGVALPQPNRPGFCVGRTLKETSGSSLEQSSSAVIETTTMPECR